MQVRRSALLAFTLAAAIPGAAGAQSRDSSAFHRGQWGVEFNIGSGFGAAALIKFKSPRSAWLVDFRGSYSHAATMSPPDTLISDNAFVSIRPGWRGYRPLGQRVYAVTTVGLSIDYRWSQASLDTVFTFTTRGLGGGAYGELGATWLVTPHLGLGAHIGATANYSHTKSSAGGSPSIKRFDFTFGTISLAGQLYF